MPLTAEEQHLRTVYGREIYFQVYTAIHIHESCKAWMRSVDCDARSEVIETTFELTNAEVLRQYLEDILNHSANLSRIFYSGKNSHRSTVLRRLFKLRDESQLKSRKVRNALQHQDERIDVVHQKILSDTDITPLLSFEADSTGKFMMEWYGATLSFEESEQLIAELHELKQVAIEVLNLQPPLLPAHTPARLPKNMVMRISCKVESVSHDEYLRQTGLPKDTPYPGEIK